MPLEAYQNQGSISSGGCCAKSVPLLVAANASPKPALNLLPVLVADLVLDEVVHGVRVWVSVFRCDFHIVRIPIGHVFEEDESETKSLAPATDPFVKRIVNALLRIGEGKEAAVSEGGVRRALNIDLSSDRNCKTGR
jgi:hypothetical protein